MALLRSKSLPGLLPISRSLVIYDTLRGAVDEVFHIIRLVLQMPLSLGSLPYEVLSSIIEGINFQDVVNLARTSKQLQFLEREDKICRKILEEKLPFCKEFIAAERAGSSFSSAFRRVAKRYHAIASARPFSAAILCVADDFSYWNGNLCYILDHSLRILDLHGSGRDEVVISIPRLLRRILDETAQCKTGRFRVLYYSESIIACLYTSSTPEDLNYLIAFNISHGDILLVESVVCTEKSFVRHTSKVLVFGTYSDDEINGHKRWVIRTYRLGEEQSFEQRICLKDLNGCDIGSNVCFEIFGKYFYALSNQTNAEVEEVDWTSFYHCARFPLESPSTCFVEQTPLDKHMWRRQHREGPLDDRWTNLMLERDQSNGELQIVETRREFLLGAGRSRRTHYRTRLVFPERSPDETEELQILASMAPDLSFSNCSNVERQMLATLTNDRLALTLTAGDNPHWLSPQTRYPRNFHPSDDGHYILSQTHFRYYNSMANTFLDLVDDQPAGELAAQCLRLRVGSRRLDCPARDVDGILVCDPVVSTTGEVLHGLNERYTASAVSFWPSEQDLRNQEDKRSNDLYAIMNPASHLGNIEGIGDDRSLVYATGGKEQPRGIVFVNFDPAIHLEGLKWWNKKSTDERSKASRITQSMNSDTGARIGKNNAKQDSRKPNNVDGRKPPAHEAIDVPLKQPLGIINVDQKFSGCSKHEPWTWREPAMYLAINRGFDFGL